MFSITSASVSASRFRLRFRYLVFISMQLSIFALPDYRSGTLPLGQPIHNITSIGISQIIFDNFSNFSEKIFFGRKFPFETIFSLFFLPYKTFYTRFPAKITPYIYFNAKIASYVLYRFISYFSEKRGFNLLISPRTLSKDFLSEPPPFLCLLRIPSNRFSTSARCRSGASKRIRRFRVRSKGS